RNAVRTVLSVRPLVALGVISYGVYLWHWPLFVLLNRDLEVRGARPLADWSFEAITALRLVATLVVAIVSYLVVEQPIRRGALGRRTRLAPMLVPVAALVLVAALYTSTTEPSTPQLVVASEDVP